MDHRERCRLGGAPEEEQTPGEERSEEDREGGPQGARHLTTKSGSSEESALGVAFFFTMERDEGAVQQQDLCYMATPMADDFLSMRKRTYSKTEESSWQKEHSRTTMGQEEPLLVRSLPHKERVARVQALIAKGLGDGSIAVRLNREGVACSRADVHLIRTGTRPPDGHGCLEEVTFVGV